MGEKRVPVLYLDIDGTVRHGPDQLGGRFVNKASEVIVFPEVPPLLRAYKSAGWRIIGVSNQGGIALGHVSMADVCEAMLETNRQCGELFDKMAFCQHHPAASNPEFAVCWCRKPRPGLAIETALSLASVTGEIYPPHLALFVGDRDEDRQCANTLNVKFMDAADWRTSVGPGVAT